MQRYKRFTTGTLIALSVGIGAGTGVALHNIGAGISVGIAVSAILGGGCAVLARQNAACCRDAEASSRDHAT